MSTRARRRIALYGIGFAAIGTLSYAGWFHRADADSTTLLACAQAELKFGCLTSAGDKARQVLTVEPNDLHALLIDAHCRSRAGDFEGARASYERALSSGVADVNVAGEIRVALALDSLRQGKAEDARAQLDLLTGITDPEARVKVFYVLGLAHERTGDMDLAVKAYSMAASEACDSQLDLILDSAARLSALGKSPEALAAFEQQLLHLTEKISVARVNYRLAKLKFQAGHADSAREHLRQLRGLPRAALAKELAEDAEYWRTKIGRGDVPAEFGNLVSSSLTERDVKQEPNKPNQGNR